MVKSKLSILLVLMLTVFAAYVPVLKAGFNSLDDQFSIVNNERIRHPDNLGKIFTASFFNDTHYYRPMVEASFLLEYQWAKLNPFFYHLNNILLHGLNAFLIFILISLIMREKIAALGAAFLFAVHPIQSEAVVNIAGRSILLSAFFLLISFICYVLLRQSKFKFICYTVSLVAFVCALLCKESAAMLPILFLSYSFFIDRKRGKSFLIAILSVVPYFVVLGAVIIFRHTLGISELYHWGSYQELILGFLSFLRGVITYLRLLIFPVGLHFDRSQEMFMSFVQLQLIGTVVFWWIAAKIFMKTHRRLPAEIKFFLTWFALELFPVAQIVTTIGVSPGYISLAEHFVYIASIGIFAITGMGFQKVYESVKKEYFLSPHIFRIGAVGFLTFFFLMTIEQSIYAGNIPSMYRRSVAMNPHNARVMFNLGLELAKLNKFEEAEKTFRRALRLDPGRSKIRIALGKSLCDQGKYLDCLDEYNSVADAGGDADLLQTNRSLTYKIVLKKAQDFEAKGDLKNASIYYERYLSSGLGGVGDIISRLEKMNASLF